MKNSFIFLLLLSFITRLDAQDMLQDSVQIQRIQEVIVIGTTKVSAKEQKPLGSIDEYLLKSAKIDMVRRGAYAWEPLINNMPTERTLVTIDGMRIFGACTDKMDPITSYVEVSNLSEAAITSGQEGSCHGSTIGGAIDLKRNRSSFGARRWNFSLNTGFESVNQQKIFGASGSFKNEKFYTDLNFMRRDAENYRAGSGLEIPFSQFEKINVSGISGFKPSENTLVEGSLIYDKATDVGYPALPMDVSLAEAVIASLKFQIVPAHSFLKNSETKIYFNTITHRMDDTKRPAVPIHMDMPGWSKTFGYYSQASAAVGKHSLLVNLNGFYNQSVAEMTMYPHNAQEPLMFMYTWPDVRTLYQGIFLEDRFRLSEAAELKFSAAAGFHQNKVASEAGLSSLQIFHPEMSDVKNRLVKSFSANFKQKLGVFEAGVGAGYGDRAPSVSEGYGFYLFNSFESYDYIGNPELKNESSLEANAFAAIKTKSFSAKFSAAYFHLSDYIIGEVDAETAPMTIGAAGVKKYTALASADLLNLSLDADVQLLEPLKWTAQLVYGYGRDHQNRALPFISPFSFSAALKWDKNQFSAEAGVTGSAEHADFAAEFGETFTPGFLIANASAGRVFKTSAGRLVVKAGIENIFDRFYRTYADWNDLPRPGRNFFLNLNFSF